MMDGSWRGTGQSYLRFVYFATFLTESGVMYGVFFLIHFYLPADPLPSCVHSIRSVMQKYLEERDELTFDKIFNQKIGKFEHCINYTMKKCATTPKC